jgi:hypothetical protein
MHHARTIQPHLLPVARHAPHRFDWAEKQFRLMGRRDARDLAVAQIASNRGIALLTNTFRGPELMARESPRLERWIDSLACPPPRSRWLVGGEPADPGTYGPEGSASDARPAPGSSGRGLVSDSVVRHERPLTCPQEIVTVEGAEAIPFATTTKVLLPLGVDPGIVNWVEELAPGAIDTELQSCVRA